MARHPSILAPPRKGPDGWLQAKGNVAQFGAMNAPTRIVEVLLPLALAIPYSYRVPEGMTIAEGDYVRVPLGTRELDGVVWSLAGQAPKSGKMRDVLARHDLPPMPGLHRQFIDWVANYYLEPKGGVLRLAIRAPGVFAAAPERVAFRLSGSVPEKLTAQRQRVVDLLADGPPLSAAEIKLIAGVGASVVKGLEAAGVIEPVTLPGLKSFSLPNAACEGFALSPEQAAAAKILREKAALAASSVCLLDGVTGSGKTEVYFEAMAAALARGAQVLLLLPEIALTSGFLSRVEERFGVAAAGWHSDMRPRERERVWRGVADGSARIVVGARSALFLPWANPGLIVVDEEHESAFKQEEGVNYHARDMAVVYGALGKFAVVLSSATPSLESLVNADRGRFVHVRLADRHGRAELPEIQLIDMRLEKPQNGQWLSDGLTQAVADTLAKGEQALLFLNRRGYAPLTLCRTCGHRLHCPHCAAALVEHRFRRVLMCHHCGHQEGVPEACPGCGDESSLVPCGPGIERLAEEAKTRFAGARIALLSSDLMRGQALRETLSGVAQGQYDLILGTQLVAKGHHFPNLTLAGVVDADLALESGDPRAGERTWAMLAQVSGRAGRGQKPGRALIQSYVPDHPIFQALAKGDREQFLAHEKHMREAAGLPPFGRLAAVIVSGANASETDRFARQLAAAAPLTTDAQLMGPAPAPIQIVRGRHRWRFLVKTARGVDIQAYLRAWIGPVQTKGSLRVDIDVDPYSFL